MLIVYDFRRRYNEIKKLKKKMHYKKIKKSTFFTATKLVHNNNCISKKTFRVVIFSTINFCVLFINIF